MVAMQVKIYLPEVDICIGVCGLWCGLVSNKEHLHWRQKPTDAIVIHQSDRGKQYRSNEYVKLLKEHHAQISMTENGDPYENAMAESVNDL